MAKSKIFYKILFQSPIRNVETARDDIEKLEASDFRIISGVEYNIYIIKLFAQTYIYVSYSWPNGPIWMNFFQKNRWYPGGNLLTHLCIG